MAKEPMVYPTPWGPNQLGNPLGPRTEPKPNIGKRSVMQSVPAGANFTLLPTNLITARINQPQQWVITVMQALANPNGVTPWNYPAADEGSTNVPGVGTVVPRTSQSSPMQIALNWGAGGAAFQTRFDYPLAGATFGLTADTVDLNVTFRNGSPTYASQGIIPVVGAFMVQGTAADPSPLRWAEEPRLALSTQTLYWTIKPYARKLLVQIGATHNGANSYLGWRDGIGGLFWQRWIPTGYGEYELDVPAQASVFEFYNDGAFVGGCPIGLEWRIGLT